MLKEAIDRIAELGCSASGIEVVPLHHRTKLIREGNTYREVEVSADPRDDVVATVDDLALLLEGSVDAVVYVGKETGLGIVAVMDINFRDDRIRIPLDQSEQLKTLLKLVEGVNQKTLVTSLREGLAGCVEDKFLAIVRRLDFSRKSDGRGDIQHGRESLGRSVEAAIQSSEGDIPETVIVELPWVTNIDLPVLMTIKCAVTVDVVNERIALRPVGDELRTEELRVRRAIAVRIAEAVDVPVVVGEPG